MRSLNYLTFDSLQEGVGASQALSYVLKIAPHRQVKLISFEKTAASQHLIDALRVAGIEWKPLDFGKFGPIGGVNRIFRMSKHIDKKSVIHARGNMSAISAMLRNPHNWIWDCRSMHADQRLALSGGELNKLVYLGMRILESCLARFSSRVIVITNSVKEVFQDRYSIPVEKMLMISTCVDTGKFIKRPLPPNETIRILLSGTFSPAYDLTLINKILAELRVRTKIHVTVAASLGATSSWNSIRYDEYLSVPHDKMNELIEKSHCGFSIWKNDLGICLRSVASTKTAEFLAMGRPVFINSKQGDFEELFNRYDIGVVTDKQDDQSVLAYVDKMLGLLLNPNMPTNCRKLAEENFSLDSGVSKLLELYSSLD